MDKFGILIYKDAQPMDIIGPWEVLAFWKGILKAPIEMILVSEDGGLIHCVNHITLESHTDFVKCPPLDYLIIPGGPGRLVQVKNTKLISFIQNQAKNCKYILSVCTGMFLLQKAGLLQNKSATTYWRALPELKAFPDVTVKEARVVKSGNVWSAGGVSSGIDLALELIAETAGKETAGQVQLLFEYFPQNKTFCNLETADTLPPNNNADTTKPYLPEYIREYIKKYK